MSVVLFAGKILPIVPVYKSWPMLSRSPRRSERSRRRPPLHLFDLVNSDGRVNPSNGNRGDATVDEARGGSKGKRERNEANRTTKSVRRIEMQRTRVESYETITAHDNRTLIADILSDAVRFRRRDDPSNRIPFLSFRRWIRRFSFRDNVFFLFSQILSL